MGKLFELKLFDVTIDDAPARDAIASGRICWRHPSRLMAIELPTSLIRFIRASVPTYQAAEVLLFLAAHPERIFTPEELVVSMRPAVLTVPAARQYLALFLSRGLVVERDGAVAYGPVSWELEQAIGELAHAYNERPVTLIKVIYTMTDGNMRSFADAFDLRRD